MISEKRYSDIATYLEREYVGAFENGGNFAPPRTFVCCFQSAAFERSLEDVVDQVDETFSQALLRMIDERGMADPEVYKRAHLDRRLFLKIRGNVNYQPTRQTALALAIALRLNEDETRDFLGRAGFALSRSSKADLIVEYFIVRGEFDLLAINEALFAFGQPPIDKLKE